MEEGNIPVTELSKPIIDSGVGKIAYGDGVSWKVCTALAGVNFRGSMLLEAGVARLAAWAGEAVPCPRGLTPTSKE